MSGDKLCHKTTYVERAILIISPTCKLGDHLVRVQTIVEDNQCHNVKIMRKSLINSLDDL